MKKRGRLAALLLLALALLGGCMSEIEERAGVDLAAMPIAAPVAAPQEDGWTDGTMTAALYFLDEQGERLLPVTREIAVPGGELPAQAALRALLGGPLEGEAAWWPELGNVQAEAWLELSGGIATVNLPGRARALTPQMLYALRLAIAATLTELPDVSYVNVLVGGREEGVDLGATLPAGTLSRVTDPDVASQYRRASELAQDGGCTRLATLFFPAPGGAFVLPSVRGVQLASTSAIDVLYTLLTELGRSDAQAMENVPAPMDYIVEMPEIVRAQDGATRAIELRFSQELLGALEAAGLSRDAYMAMLTDTLMGFVPGVDGLQVEIGGERVTAPEGGEPFAQGLAARGDYLSWTGAPATLYAPGAREGTLKSVRAVLPQASQRSPRARLAGLMALEGAQRALPQGVTEADVLAVYVRGDNAAVDLSPAFAQALSALTPQQERAAVYAMVNTLTEDDGIREATFFFGGEQVEALAGGLEMRGSFARDPGMVVDESGSMGVL